MTCRPFRSAGFSLVEVMLAAMILGIGFVMLLPAFVTGLNESRQSIDSAVGMLLCRNAEAYCQTVLEKTDVNFTAHFAAAASNSAYDSGLVTYQFGVSPPPTPAPVCLPNAASVRVHGDPVRSRFYWSMLFRIRGGVPNQVELWILCCKREGGGGVTGFQAPASISLSGSAGSRTFSGGASADRLEPNTCVLTDGGEVLTVVARGDDGTITTDVPATTAFSSLTIVPEAGASASPNGCIFIAYTRMAF